MTYVSERKEGKNQLFSSIPYMEVENSVLFISVRVFFSGNHEKYYGGRLGFSSRLVFF